MVSIVPGIPIPESIPAPAWIFDVLGTLLFIVHILLANIILGGSLIALVRLFRKKVLVPEPPCTSFVKRLPVFFALTVTMGVAPLLFVQVLYGHFYYTSSILSAVYVISVIPAIIVAYYGIYIHVRSTEKRRLLSRSALLVTTIALLFIGFVFVNNVILSTQPALWKQYFDNRSGLILALSEPSFIPRFLHFVTASIAIGGLATALWWHFNRSESSDIVKTKVKEGLQTFSSATISQVVIGSWFLFSTPHEITSVIMGGSIFPSIVFVFGLGCAIAVAVVALTGRILHTIVLAVLTVTAMAIVRNVLIAQTLKPHFDISTLKVIPQYDILGLFLAILTIGLFVVYIMVRAGFRRESGRA